MNKAPADKTAPLGKRRALWLGLGLAVAAGLNLVSVFFDRTPIWGDAAGKFYEAIVFRDSLSAGCIEAVRCFFEEVTLYPPLIKVLGGLLLFAYPRLPDPDIAMILVQFFYVGLGIGVYAVGRKLFAPCGTRTALLAAFFAATTPGVFGLSKTFMLDLPLAAMVWIALACLLHADGFANRKMSVAFGAACALGLLTKQAFALYMGLPTLLVLLWAVADRKNRKAALAGFARAAIVVGAVAGPWYALRFPSTYERYTVLNRLPQSAGDVGLSAFYPEMIWNNHVGWIYGMLAGLGLLRLILSPALRRRHPWVGASLVCLVAPYVYITSSAIEQMRFLAPLLPAFALFMTAALMQAEPKPAPRVSRWLRGAAVALAVGCGLVQFLALNLGTHRWNAKVFAGRPLSERGGMLSENGLFGIDRTGMDAAMAYAWIQNCPAPHGRRVLLLEAGTNTRLVQRMLKMSSQPTPDGRQVALLPIKNLDRAFVDPTVLQWPDLLFFFASTYRAESEEFFQKFDGRLQPGECAIDKNGFRSIYFNRQPNPEAQPPQGSQFLQRTNRGFFGGETPSK